MPDDNTGTGTSTGTDDQQGQGDQGQGQQQTGKTYSKQELDAIVAKAVASARKDFGDYADLKTKAEELDTLKEASKSEQDKLRDRADKMTRERDAALTRARETLIRSESISEASKLGVVDPEAVAALLPRGHHPRWGRGPRRRGGCQGPPPHCRLRPGGRRDPGRRAGRPGLHAVPDP